MPDVEAKQRPERTCTGCRQKAAQAELVRIVRRDGRAVVDAPLRFKVRGGVSKQLPGRGAWVHPRPRCVTLAAQGGLARSFRAPLATDAGELAQAIRACGESTTRALLRAAAQTGGASGQPDVMAIRVVDLALAAALSRTLQMVYLPGPMTDLAKPNSGWEAG